MPREWTRRCESWVRLHGQKKARCHAGAWEPRGARHSFDAKDCIYKQVINVLFPCLPRQLGTSILAQGAGVGVSLRTTKEKCTTVTPGTKKRHFMHILSVSRLVPVGQNAMQVIKPACLGTRLLKGLWLCLPVLVAGRCPAYFICLLVMSLLLGHAQ